MKSIQIIACIFWIVILPLMLGNCVAWKKENKITSCKLMLYYSWGMIIMCSTFLVLTIPLTIARKSLELDIILWIILCISILVVGILYRIFKEKGQRAKHNYINQTLGEKDELLLSIATVVLVALQIYYLLFYMHIDNDDAWYVGSAVTSYYTNTINTINPYTGELLDHFIRSYTLAPYPIYCAALAKLTQVHPAIIMRTVLPIFFIVWGYGVWDMILSLVFRDKESVKKWCLFFIALLNMLGGFSIRNISVFFLTRIWQGKAILCSIIIPLVIYFLINLFYEETWKNWIAVLLTVMTGLFVSSSSLFLLPLLVMGIAVIILLKYKNRKYFLKVGLLLVPCIVQMGLYLIINKL